MKQMSEIYPLLTHEPDRGPHPAACPSRNVILNRLWLTPPAGDEWANICMSVGNLGDLSELTWRLHILSALYFTSQLNVFEPVKPRHFLWVLLYSYICFTDTVFTCRSDFPSLPLCLIALGLDATRHAARQMCEERRMFESHVLHR